ncbi:uncharacterized protein LOC107717841 isoform X2 [Sinocyclocheilus rhinocerous]|uniref:uncharacterized protein LOC107717841 isoform X2 n=1 Tax=Sinocyclocheilus rhinocerous TaxID=307959 RepID=UPI0007B99F31|nr:PREDICTED: uncharacterized protein LOC107717841 isoform X2 [Sinocyclocheilus rhinocerous]
MRLSRFLQLFVSGGAAGSDLSSLTHTELVNIMEWKLTKGKFRPRLQQLIGSNSEEAVPNSTSKASGLMPDVQVAITELCKLKGVGPATASAVLVAGAPGEVAFMADEAVESIAELRPVEYTAKHYALFLQKILNKTSQLNTELDSSQGGAVFMGLGRGQSDSALIITGVQSDGCNTHCGQSEAREEEDGG